MLASLLLVPLLAIAPADVPNPREHGHRVADPDSRLNLSDFEWLDSLAEHIHRRSQTEVVFVVVADVPDKTPDAFTTELFELWGAEGVLVVYIERPRSLEFVAGEALEDTFSDRSIVSIELGVQPHLKKRSPAENIEYAIGVVGGRLGVDLPERPPPPAPAKPKVEAAAKKPKPKPKPKLGQRIMWTLGGIFGVAMLIVLVKAALRRAHNLNCPCGGRRELLDEIEEEALLTSGQRREEEIGSVDYKFYVCPVCSSVSVDEARGWSFHARCVACHHRTAARESNTVREASYDEEGLVSVSESCQYCGHHNTYTRTIPRRTRPRSHCHDHHHHHHCDDDHHHHHH